MRLKQKSFTKMLFTFIALVSFTFIGAVNVEAKTVTVTDEAELRSAIAENYTEESTIKLGNDITVSEYIKISLNDKPLTFDLAGNKLEITNGNFFIYFGSDGSTSYDTGSFTFKDSSSGSIGQLIVSKVIKIGSENTNSAAETPKTYNFTINGGNYSATAGTSALFELFSNSYYDYDKSITANITIKKGTFTNSNDLLWVPTADKDIKMNFMFDTLTYYNSNNGKLGDNRFSSIKFEDVVPADSKIYYFVEETTTSSVVTELTDRTTYVASLSAIRNGSYIKIIKDEGFDIEDVSLDDLSYGYSSAGVKNIFIYNRGQSSLQVKTVASSSTDFIVEGTGTPTISAGATNTDFTIKAKDGLDAGDYSADIIVTDANDKTYTAKVTLKVKPETVIQIADSIDTITEYMSDDTTDIIKLNSDITFNGQDLIFYIMKDKTLDLNGYSIISDNNASYGIKFWYYKNASVKIIDSSNSDTSKIKLTYSGNASCYAFNNSIIGNDVTTADFSIDGVDFESSSYNTFLISNGASKKLGSLSIKNSNIDGFYQIFDDVDFTSVKLTNVTKTKTSPETTYLSNSSDSTVADITGEDSILEYYTSGTTKVVADRTTKLSDINTYWGDISIKYLNGFNVDNVSLTETYKVTPTEKEVTIKNRGTSDLQVKNVTVDSENFVVVGKTQPTISAGATDNTSFKIKAKDGLPAGNYSATITVTDMNDEKYTATVTLKVNAKELTGHSITMDNWTYGESTKNPVVNDLTELGIGDYEISYAKKDSTEFSSTKPTKAGDYILKLHVTNSNYSAEDVTSEFTINKNNTKIEIKANSNSWVYDGNDHTDSGYKVYYDDSEVTTGILSTGDTISITVTGSVKDVDDTNTGNNVATYTLENSDCYSNIVVTNGTLTITPITTPIIVTAGSSNREYTGEKLTNNNYTYTDGVLLAGDMLSATVTGEQLYVGTSDNKVSDIIVKRGDKDITSNYTFGTHIKGTLKVEPVLQTVNVNENLNVKVGGTLTIAQIKEQLNCNLTNYNIKFVSGTAGTFDATTGFTAGTSEGTVKMEVVAPAIDVNSDGTYEYKETSSSFFINVVNKDTITISGLNNNEEFTYDGNPKKPTGTIGISNINVSLEDLEIRYNGTGYDNETAPTDAGTYTVTYKVKDSNANYTGSVSYNFTIKKAQYDKVTLSAYSFEYTGSDITPSINNKKSKIEITGDTTSKNVANYQIVAKLIDKKNYEWKDGSTDDLTLNWTIVKATPDYTVPTGLTSIKGKTLNDVALDGRFTWNDPTIVLTAGTRTYKATYTPEDTDNYKTITDIDIQVVVKDLFDLTTSVDGGNGTVTASKTNIVEGNNVEVTFTPDTGYMIDKILVNGVETKVTSNKLNLTMNENKDVKVSYKKIPFAVTVKDVTGATITPNGAVTVNYGDNQEFTITANNGYKLVKLLVDGTDKISDMVDDKLTLTNVTSDIDLEVVVEKIVYEVIEGANQKYVITENDKAVFKINANLRLFNEVYVDDVLVDSANYDLESGSTIITLKKEYVDTLSEGVHTLRAVFNDGGEATTQFTVAKVNTPTQDDTKTEDNPKTGDNIIFYVATGILSMIGLAGAGIYTYRRKQEN